MNTFKSAIDVAQEVSEEMTNTYAFALIMARQYKLSPEREALLAHIITGLSKLHGGAVNVTVTSDRNGIPTGVMARYGDEITHVAIHDFIT